MGIFMHRWLPTNEIDYMVENGYWIDNRFEWPIPPDPNEESQEALDAEAREHNEEGHIYLQDAIEAAQGPMPRPEYLPELGSKDDEIPF
jgi:hypothetical protein